LPSTSHVGELGSALAVGIILRHQGTARRWRLSDAGRAARRLMLKLASVIALTNQMAIWVLPLTVKRSSSIAKSR